MVLLFDPAGALLFEKARNLERQDVEQPDFQVSRTIIRQVRDEGKPFFERNLPAHPGGRFSDSVFRLNLIAVICLPLVHEGRSFGVVYIDSRSHARACALWLDLTNSARRSFSSRRASPFGSEA